MKQITIWLRLEGGVVLIAAVLAYSALGFSEIWFLLLLLAADISMVGYLINRDMGRKLYNLGHSYVLPASLLLLGLIQDVLWVQQAALIWIGHIGFDRLMGYGLKIGPGFKDTHLGRIGHKK